MARQPVTSWKLGVRPAPDDHVCLRHPCYYCLVRSGKPIPADILTGPMPARPGHHATRRADLSRIEPGTRERIHRLLRALGGVDSSQLVPGAPFADLSQVPASARQTIVELLELLEGDSDEAHRLRLVEAAHTAKPELIARFVLDGRAVMRECEAHREEYLAVPAADHVGVRPNEILPSRIGNAIVRSVVRLLTTGTEAPPVCFRIPSMTGGFVWKEGHFRRANDRALVEVYLRSPPFDGLKTGT